MPRLPRLSTVGISKNREFVQIAPADGRYRKDHGDILLTYYREAERHEPHARKRENGRLHHRLQELSPFRTHAHGFAPDRASGVGTIRLARRRAPRRIRSKPG